MKKILCCFLACLFLCGCSISVQDLSHDVPHGVIPTQTTAPEETGPTFPPNPYGPLDFGFEGDYLACYAGEYMVGIDVSYWQGNIDWQKVKDSGIEFVMLRIGQRGSEKGIIAEDKMVRTYYEGASAVGLKIGGYFFSQAITPEEAVEEAEFMLSVIKGWNIEMPLVFDWEYIDETSRTADMDARTLTDCTIAFCNTVQAAGYTPMIYSNRDQTRNTLYLEELIGYKFWLAMYETTMTYEHKIDMWQYTCTGSVPGISGNVDINLYLDYE